MEPGQQPTAVYPHSTDGAKWASGLVLRGDDFAQLNALSKARARKPDVVLVEVPAKSWDQITRRSRLQDMLGGSSVRNVWWVPIVPEGGSAQGAVAGSDSAKWNSFGKALQDTRNGRSVVRLNLDSLAGVDAASRSKAWQSAVAAIKSSAPGALVATPETFAPVVLGDDPFAETPSRTAAATRPDSVPTSRPRSRPAPPATRPAADDAATAAGLPPVFEARTAVAASADPAVVRPEETARTPRPTARSWSSTRPCRSTTSVVTRTAEADGSSAIC